jgi:hypothetical protein
MLFAHSILVFPLVRRVRYIRVEARRDVRLSLVCPLFLLFRVQHIRPGASRPLGISFSDCGGTLSPTCPCRCHQTLRLILKKSTPFTRQPAAAPLDALVISVVGKFTLSRWPAGFGAVWPKNVKIRSHAQRSGSVAWSNFDTFCPIRVFAIGCDFFWPNLKKVFKLHFVRGR